MVHFCDITEQNFKDLALLYYDNPQCFSMDEFYDDVKRFNYVTNLFENYRKTNVLRERLILNHLIVLHNLFGSFVSYGLHFRTSENNKAYLNSFLIYLNYLPKELENKFPVIDEQLLKQLEEKI